MKDWGHPRERRPTVKTSLKALAQNVDNEILELNLRLAQKEARREQLAKCVGKVTQEVLIGVAAEISKVVDSINELGRNVDTLEGVYEMYRWNRAFIVSGGHVHRVQEGCPGFKYGTVAYLVPQCSALTEDEIVELAGERACTHCYPSAPLSVLQQASKLFAHDEQAKAERRAERETKRSAKEAAKLTVTLPRGEWGDGKPKEKTFGTVRGARNEAAHVYGTALYYPTTSEGYIQNFAAIVAAIAEREELDIADLATEIRQRVEKKYLREIQKPGIGYGGCSKEEARRKLEDALSILAKY